MFLMTLLNYFQNSNAGDVSTSMERFVGVGVSNSTILGVNIVTLVSSVYCITPELLCITTARKLLFQYHHHSIEDGVTKTSEM